MKPKKKDNGSRKDYIISDNTTCKKQVVVMQIKKDRILISENGISLLCLSAF